MFAGLVVVPAIAGASSSPMVDAGEPSVPPGGTCSWDALGDQTRELMGEMGMLQLEFQELLDSLRLHADEEAVRSADVVAQTCQQVASTADALNGAIKQMVAALRDKPKT